MLELHPKNILLLMVSWLWFCNIQAQNLTNDGAYIKSTSGSYWYFTGNDNMNIISQTADHSQFYNAIVDFSGSGSYKLTLDAQSYLTINGALTLNDTILLEGNDTQMASLITGTSVTGSLAKVQQFLSENRWHYISSPVSNEQIGSYLNVYLKSWDEVSGEWTYLFNPLTTPLNVGEGYAVWASSSLTGDTLIALDGLLNTGDVNKNLSYTPASLKTGWHFLGNPFPCNIEWTSSWNLTNVDPTIYIYDGNQYLSWNYNLSEIENTLPSAIIPSTQGFMVKANNTGASLTIPENQRLHSAEELYKATGADISLKLKAVGNGRYDLMSIYMDSQSTLNFDNLYDSYKIYGHADAPQLYSILPDEIAAINGIPIIQKGTEVSVGFEVEVAGQYAIEIVDFVNNISNLSVFILDKKLEQLTNLSQTGFYQFYAEPDDNSDRFTVIFGDPASGIQDKDESDIQIFALSGTIKIQSDVPLNGELELVDMIGRVIASVPLINDRNKEINVNAEPGYYLVLVRTTDRNVAGKLYLH